MSRPKQKRARKPVSQPARAKGPEKARPKARPPTQQKPWIFFIVAALAVVLIIAAVAWLMATRAGGEQSPAKSYPIQGTQHIAEGEAHPPYNSNPPTSGWHYQREASWGVHDAEILDEQAIHNLEHGGIWISYQPSLDPASVDKLREVTRRYRSKVLLTPRGKNDSKIALAAWGKLDTLDTVDEGRVVNFIRSFINQGPERVPD